MSVLNHAGTAGADAYWISLGLWAFGEQVLRIRDRRAHVSIFSRTDRGSVWWVTVCIVGAILAGSACARARLAPLPAPTLWLVIGLVTVWGGIAVRVWAVRTLGQFFTTVVVVQSAHRVITGGPFRLVRHPSYLGLLLILGGFGLALGDLSSFAVMLVLTVLALVPRIRVEEAALSDRLGADYRSYAQGRARLVPGVW